MEIQNIGKIAFFVILILMEALVSMAESAFSNANEAKLTRLAQEGDRKAQAVLEYVKEPAHYINVVEVILAGSGTAVGIMFSGAIQNFVLGLAKHFELNWHPTLVRGIGMVIFGLLILYVVILLGNVFPKKLGQINSEQKARNFYPLFHGLQVVLKPLLALINASERLLMFLFRINPKDLEENVTEDEIISILNEGHEQGVLEDSEAVMISNIISLDDKEVKNVMTHFKKVEAIDKELSFEEAIQFMLSKPYSRFPLYEGNIDNVIGILNLKDMAEYYVSGKDRTIPLLKIARKPFFVADTQDIDLVLSQMQSEKSHMAVVVDEYGQTSGIVTMEDIIEEIIGNIFDEYDKDEKMIMKQGRDRYLIRGLAKLDEIGQVLGADLAHDEFETINGLLIDSLGHLPAPTERATINISGWDFHILDVKNRTINFVRATREQKEQLSEMMKSQLELQKKKQEQGKEPDQDAGKTV